MANDTRSTRRSKDDESTSSRKKAVDETAETSGLRRSTRGSPFKEQITTNPSTTRKSGRLESMNTTPPAVKRKSGIVDKRNISSPLRRSDRFIKHRRSDRIKKHQSASSSSMKEIEKGSHSSDVKSIKLKKEKSVKWLTLEGREANGIEEQDPKPDGVKKKKMNARTFSTFFRPQLRRDTVPDNTSCCGSCVSKQLGDGEDGIECCGERMGEKQRGHCTEETSERGGDSTSKNSEAEALGNDCEVEVSCSSQLCSSRKEPCHSSADDSLNPSKSGQRLKRQRVENDLPEPEHCLDVPLKNGPHCSPLHKDSGESEANVRRSVEEKDGTTWEGSPSVVQIDDRQDMCVICKLGGKLLFCHGKGCKRSYHTSCLDLPFDDVDVPTAWHCPSCVQKKIESGVHSVSEGVESIWDAREVEVQDTENGLQKENQYFVKYKGLAHIHNGWVPERQLVLEAPLLFSKFNENEKVVKWREEWTMPHRLLKKRLLSSPKQQEENQFEPNGDKSHCRFEWLVKWCGLGYEHATWELESASFLQSPLAQSLMRGYENRHQRAKRATPSSLLEKNKKGPLLKFSKLPVEVLPGIDYSQLTFTVNKLREHWHKGQNAVLFDDKERLQKMILFIGSLVSNISQPFLVISDSSALSLWEAEFSRLDSSIDVVIYSGKKGSRRIIRTCEFYEEGGCIMFQVLLSPIEALVEDFEMLECLRWEAIIVDECQCSAISKHFDRIKILSTEVRFLLFNGQLTDSRAEHLNLLSLLESPSDLDTGDGQENDLDEGVGKMKKLLQYIVYDCKPDVSRFVEYWVPVQISNVQLEQYCATLHSNYQSLRSLSKKDPFGTLHNILNSTRKICDHPYLVDPLLQGVLTKDLPPAEFLGVGINASGKLKLLDAILSNIRDRGLRVIILFQSIGGRDLMGDILEDFMGQRFGPDSYERLDGGFLSSKKKLAALNKFNEKGSGRFIFLLESRACHCSIKFSSVDGIVIFNGDWNPTNDIRALQKVSIGSPVEQIKVFRLYSACTVEEIVLVLATHNVTLDVQSLSLSSIHMLLMWGASYLFNKLDEFHGGNISTTSASSKSEPSILKDVAKEFLNVLFQDGEDNHPNSSLVIQVQHSGGTYRKNVSLLGEIKIQLPDGEEPTLFWTKLLEGRNPQWRHSSGPLQRNRKRAQNFGDLLKKPELEADEVGKKRKKVVNSKADPASLRSNLKEGSELSRNKEGVSGVLAGSSSQFFPRSAASVTRSRVGNDASRPSFSSDGDPALHKLNVVDSEEAIGVHDVQWSLHAFLKREISTLCGILKVTEDVKVVVGKFLEYIIQNHHVSSEPASILQAFQISLCWIAASMGKSKSDRYKIDRKESLLLAKKHLNFCCTEEEVNEVYLMLRPLKKTFLSRLENFNGLECPQDALVAAEDTMKEPPDARMPQPVVFRPENVKVEIEERSENQESVKDPVPSQPEEAILIDKCENQIAKLLRNHQEEIQEVHRILEEERLQLENQHRVDSTIVRSIHGNNPVGLDKLRRLEDEFAKKKEEHNCKRDIRLEEVLKKQLDERNKMRQPEAFPMVGRPTSFEQAEQSCEMPLDGSGFGGTEKIVSVSGCPVEDQCSNGILASGMAPCVMSSTAAGEAVGGDGPVKTPTVAVCPDHESSAVDSCVMPSTAAGEAVGGDGPVKIPTVAVCPNHESSAVVSSAPENNASMDPPSAGEQIRDEAHSSILDMPVLRDECSQLLTSSGISDIDEVATENQNVVGAEVPPFHATNCSREEVVAEHPNQLQVLPSSGSPIGQNQHYPHLASPVEQPCQSAGLFASLMAELHQNVENPSRSVPSDPVVLHTGANQLSGDGYTSFRNAEAVSRQGVMEALPNQVVSSPQFGVVPPINTLGGLGINLPFHSPHQAATLMPAKSVGADPLTTELERLRKQTEQTNTAYEDTIQQLKSDLEKEIEEVIAEMHRKYVARLNSEEAAFAQKKRELDTYHNKVLMNKRLADAFRSKCLERPSRALEMRKAVVPSAGQQTTTQPLQIVHHSSALFSSMPSRPPLISSINPSPGTLQTASERRAPAPHLLPFRPPPSTSARNLPIASPIVPPVFPSQPQSPHPSPMPPTYGRFDAAPHPEVAGGSPSLNNSSLSAMDLLFHVNNQPGANPPSSLSPLPGLSSSFDAMHLSECGSAGGDGMVNSAASSGVATDVVC